MKLTERIIKKIQTAQSGGADPSKKIEDTDKPNIIIDSVKLLNGQDEGAPGQNLKEAAFKGIVTGGMVGLVKRADENDERFDKLEKNVKKINKAKTKKLFSKDIGKKMFKGAAIGGGLGASFGGVFGYFKAQNDINNSPIQTVELPGYPEPVYHGVKTSAHINDGRFQCDYNCLVDHPTKDADGNVLMQDVPSQNVTGKGEVVFSEIKHKIIDPTGIKPWAVYSPYTGVIHNSGHSVEGPTIGYWKEPVVNFEIGVNVGGQIALYSLGGLALGIAGGALAALAMDKASVK